jgi:formylglycine-generating enzyme required for sulfatase activity
MAENLGIDPGEAEDMVDIYLEEIEQNGTSPPTKAVTVAAPPPKPAVVEKPVTVATAKVPEEISIEYLRNFVNQIGQQMIVVPSGVFRMGSEAHDAPPNERPITEVTLSHYYISRHPITNAQYEMFEPSHARKRAPGAGDDHPVVYVSSTEAAKFCQWLSAREKRRYRLPTEAEWEYAARGKDGRKYPWGNNEGRPDLANFADCNTEFAWSDRKVNDGFAESSPVGAFPRGASPFGVEDMAGNVWEWCQDYMEAYRGVPKTNPRGPAGGLKRVYRGGSWKSRFHSLRVTTRGSNVPNYACNDLGFRIVCECEG